eukprot:scaffold22580_cov76-Phaeocystis_antarctica.AAC.4
MGGGLRRWWLVWEQFLRRSKVQGHAGQVGRPVLRPWCDTEGERWRVREWREVQGVAGRRAKRSARCAQK